MENCRFAVLWHSLHSETMTTMHLHGSPVALVIAGCSLAIVPERNWSLSFAYYLNLRHFDGRNHLI